MYLLFVSFSFPLFVCTVSRSIITWMDDSFFLKMEKLLNSFWVFFILFIFNVFLSFSILQQQLHAQQLPHAAAAAAAAAGHPPPLPLGMGGHPGMPPTSAGAALMGLPGQLPPPPTGPGGPGGPPHPLSLLNAAAQAGGGGMPPGMPQPPQGGPLQQQQQPNGPPMGSNKHESHRERERERERERNNAAAAAAAAQAAAERDDKQSK